MASIPEIQPYQMPSAQELEPNVADWKINPNNAVLLVHDMQRFFLRPLPSTIAKPLISNVATLIGWARAHGIPVAYSAQPGRMTQKQRGLLADFWGAGMKTEAQDLEIEASCMAQEHDWKLTKWRYSAFFKTDLLSLIRKFRKRQLVICGIYAHVGILSTAIESFSHDVETFIVSDAVADFTRKDHLRTLNHAARTCACVIPTQECLR